jgi:hypothetical protein
MVAVYSKNQMKHMGLNIFHGWNAEFLNVGMYADTVHIYTYTIVP